MASKTVHKDEEANGKTRKVRQVKTGDSKTVEGKTLSEVKSVENIRISRFFKR